MIKEAMEFFLTRTQVQPFHVHNRGFFTQPLHEIRPCRAVTVKVHTLTAVVDFMGEEPNSDLMLHVVNPYRVEVVDLFIDENYRDRECYLTAERIHKEFEFGRWFDQEEMIINLMTLFEPSETLEQVKKVVSGLVSKTEVTIDDDGVSQDVKVRQGVHRVESVTIVNPMMLQPIRTFTEIEQVAAPYVLRIKMVNQIPQVAIFEAGGGAWKNEAIARIKGWLEANIAGVKVLG